MILKIAGRKRSMLQIEIKAGDIAEADCEAVVNAANNYLWMGSGVAGAIKRAGGEEIEQEAMRAGPISVGEAVVTGAGRLKARYVIHAAVMAQDLRTGSEIIRAATRSSLLRALELKVTSLAFPALGTGVGGFPLEECARVMLDEVHLSRAENSELKRVVMVLRSPEAAEIFRRELDRLSQ
jgi:O-acetyl-ADP-ribose deacetylase